MKRILAIIFAVMLLVGCSAEVDEDDSIIAPASSESTAAVSSGLEYEMVKETFEFPLEDGTVYYKNELEYPLFKGDSEVELTLNQYYEQLVAGYKDNTTDYDDLYDRLISQGVDVDSNIPYYDNVSADVTYNKKGVISLKEVSVSWSGGAHPYHTVDGYTYLISDDTELVYSDIISGGESEINKVLKKYMKESLGSCTSSEIDTLKNDTPYTLCDDGLCFYYWVGDAVDRKEIVIPFTGSSYIITATQLLSQSEVAAGAVSGDELVVDAVNEELTDTTSSQVCYYHIPKINVDDGSADEINQILLDDGSEILNNAYECADSGCSIIPCGFNYIWSCSDDNVISIVTACRYQSTGLYYAVYNFSLDTGEILSNADLRKLYGFSEQELTNLIIQKSGEKFEEKYREIKDQCGDFYDEQYQATVTAENAGGAELFVNEDGELCCVANIYALAGAEAYEHLLNLTGDTVPAEPDVFS